ncbi:D-glycero-beta-D-manno-heptose 1,7-bisphosphate 7-phosphatase [bacterium]|nr:D-glycero-beta-D-manno-heptose 1,7-bisphosphate 7-phosphatase [bacterium]MBU1991060.1 D-glycero-beta-D-manno-heptose 1,7-bisphosphate 7-phosphatase [bacterium]
MTHSLRRALFLDRDGVINIEKDYLYRVEDFEFIDGIFALCKYYQEQGYLIFVVTNQSGIAREYYSQEQFETLTDWMIKKFKHESIEIKKVYYCPHHPDISGNCTCRKPHAGMILDAAYEFHLDLKNSVLVGDKERDIEAALNAGIFETYLFDETKSVTSSKATRIVSKLDDIWKDRC